MIDPTPRILARVEARRDKYRTEIVPILPPPASLAETSFVGINSITTTKSMRRFLLAGRLLEIGDLTETPTSLARDYLALTFGHGPRIKHDQGIEFENRIAPAPVLIHPTRFGWGWYLDLEACYFSILLVSGWNLDYYPGKWLARGRPPLDFPFTQSKQARNSLVSIAQSRSARVYDPVASRVVDRRIGNRLMNRGIFCLISDVLHSLATEARALGAIYVNMDGYIFVTESSARSMAHRIEDWGLNYRVKYQGSGEVMGPGDYKIGGHRTRRLFRQPIEGETISPVPYSPWLQRRFSRFAATSNERMDRLRNKD